MNEDDPKLLDVQPDLESLIECVQREIDYRRRVYPKWIERAKMSAKFAKRQIDLMEAVLKNLESQKLTR